MRSRLRAAVPLIGYLLGIPTAAYGLARTWDGHHVAGPLLGLLGVLLMVPSWRQQRADSREARRQLLLLCVRVYPGNQLEWISRKMWSRPARIQPVLNQLVADGQLHQEPDGSYWSTPAPRLDPDWAEKRQP